MNDDPYPAGARPALRTEDDAVDEHTHAIAVHGELDIANAPELEARIDAAIIAGARAC